MKRSFSEKSVNIPVMEFRNNATWGAVCKGINEEEAYTLLARDFYGDGQMYTLVIPESFSDIKYYPEAVLDRMRKEFAGNGIRLSGKGQISIFAYDNDTFVVYPYVDNNTYDSDIKITIENAKAIKNLTNGNEIQPLYTKNNSATFQLRAQVGKFEGYEILR